MHHTRGPRRQSGLTTIGTLILAIPVAIVIYAGIRLTPVYLNYMSVSKTLTSLPAELAGQEVGPSTIQDRIERHFEIDSVNYPTVRDISITRADHGWQVEAAYYDSASLFANLSIQVKFDKIVMIKNGAGAESDE